MISGNWIVTPHAVQRFRERIAPEMTYEQARDYLIEQSLTARYVKEWKPGIFLFRGPRPNRLRFWVAFEEGRLPQLITVMAGHDPGYGPKYQPHQDKG